MRISCVSFFTMTASEALTVSPVAAAAIPRPNTAAANMNLLRIVCLICFTLHLHLRSGGRFGVKKECKELVNVNVGSGSDGLIFRIAGRIQQTFRAARLAGLAECAAMVDNLVREEYPAVLRDDLHQVLLDLAGIGLSGQIQPAGDALHVRIHD